MPISRQGITGSGVTATMPDGSTQFKINRIASAMRDLPIVANRGRVGDNMASAGPKPTSRVRIVFGAECCDIRLLYENFSVNSGGSETANVTGTITVTASFENSEGNTPISVTFNGGATSITIPINGIAISDPIAVDQASGSVAWVNTCVSGSAGWPTNILSVANAGNGGKDGDMLGQKITTTSGNGVSPISITTSGNHGLTTGDMVTVSGVGGNTNANQTNVACTVTGNTTFTITGTGNGAYTSGGIVLGNDITGLGGANMVTSGGVSLFGPAAIFGTPAQGARTASIGILGDSIDNGAHDSTGVANAGFIVRAFGGPLGCNVGFSNHSRAGTRASQLADTTAYQAQSIRRRVTMMGQSYIFEGFGINDLANGRTLAQLQADVLAIATSAYRRGARVIRRTLFPYTTSTDSFKTATNQSTQAAESNRVSFNQWVRAGCPIDPSTKAAVAVGTAGALLAGQAGHPIYATYDVNASLEVNSSNALTTDGGRWLTDGVTSNLYTDDGTHPVSAANIIAANAVPVSSVVAFA